MILTPVQKSSLREFNRPRSRSSDRWHFFSVDSQKKKKKKGIENSCADGRLKWSKREGRKKEKDLVWTEPFPPFSRYVLRHDDFTGLGPRESGLRRRRTDKVERNKCDKPKRDSVVAASRRYLKVNVLWRTAANCSNYNTRFSDYSQRRRPLLPSPLDPRRGDIDA